MNSSKVFLSVREFCTYSGLSIKAIRQGCQKGEIPHIRVGEGKNARMMINVPLYMEKLNKESLGG